MQQLHEVIHDDLQQTQSTPESVATVAPPHFWNFLVHVHDTLYILVRPAQELRLQRATAKYDTHDYDTNDYDTNDDNSECGQLF